MRYVALLRGINVGGNNRVEMSRLREVFEKLGFIDVVTYINSGNVVFDSPKEQEQLVSIIENAVKQEFGFLVPTVVRSRLQIEEICKQLPDIWLNNADMKCDILFLWPPADTPDIVEQLGIKPEIEDTIYVPGVLLWRANRDNVTKSGLIRVIGTKLYKQMTIRNCNTVRKLHQLMTKK